MKDKHIAGIYRNMQAVLRRRRIQLQLSPRELGERLGVTRKAAIGAESKKSELYLSTIIRTTEALDLPLHLLFIQTCRSAFKEGLISIPDPDKTISDVGKFTDSEKELITWLYNSHKTLSQHWDPQIWKAFQSLVIKITGELP